MSRQACLRCCLTKFIIIIELITKTYNVKLLSQNTANDYLIVSLEEQECRIQQFHAQKDQINQVAAGTFSYQDESQLVENLTKWCKQNSARGIVCRWNLSRHHYQTFNVDPPNVLAKEMDEAIKWQVKDLIEANISQVLVSHYRPALPEGPNNQIVAVVVSKSLIETLIEATQKAGLELESIDVEELTIGHALHQFLDDEKVIGYIGEDSIGLVFNFYNQGGLSFSRHKKGRFLPGNDGFSLEQDLQSQQDAFLLETQRTLDYVVSQIFRRPIDTILLQHRSDSDEELANLINQITEIQVSLISPDYQTNASDLLPPNLVDIGCALRVGK